MQSQHYNCMRQAKLLYLHTLTFTMQKDTCWTALCVTVLGDCESLSSWRTCWSPCSSGCHSILWNAQIKLHLSFYLNTLPNNLHRFRSGTRRNVYACGLWIRQYEYKNHQWQSGGNNASSPLHMHTKSNTIYVRISKIWSLDIVLFNCVFPNKSLDICALNPF